MNEVEKAYIAGIVDGEGSICLFNKKAKHTRRKFYFEPALIISNTDKKLLDWISKTANVSYNPVKRRQQNVKPHWKQGYYFWIGRMVSLLNFLREIQQYLISKRKRCDLLIEFLEIQKENFGGELRNRGNTRKTYYYTPRQHEIYKEIKKYNTERVEY